MIRRIERSGLASVSAVAVCHHQHAMADPKRISANLGNVLFNTGWFFARNPRVHLGDRKRGIFYYCLRTLTLCPEGWQTFRYMCKVGTDARAVQAGRRPEKG
jgi:hypothetical protein